MSYLVRSRFYERIITQVPTDVGRDNLSIDTRGGYEIRRQTRTGRLF
jgi:hypothetical protein